MTGTYISLRSTDRDFSRLYEAVSENPRYSHYVRIPGRICKCLDHFHVAYNRRIVEERLHAYYLFIGVVDDALDTEGLRAGEEILRRLHAPHPRFDEETKRSSLKLVTEVFKSHLTPGLYTTMLPKLAKLYEAVVLEQSSTTTDEYIKARKRVGHLTAELSYLLIEPAIKNQHQTIRIFLTRVGEIGCLVDSLIDLSADNRSGVISFEPSLRAHLHLAARVFYEGVGMLITRPRLIGLFLAAACDDLRDRFRRPGPRLATAAATLDL